MKVCEVCGITSDKKNIVSYHGHIVCQKHKMQLLRYGIITDPSPICKTDKNPIVFKKDWAELHIKDKIVLIDLDDVEKISQHKWYCYRGYVRSRINNKLVQLHRFVLNYSGNKEVDHINRNPLDNRKKNLHIVTRCENMHNLQARGIFKDKNKWRVQLCRYGKKYSIGRYETYDEALRARNDFIFTNFADEIIFI